MEKAGDAIECLAILGLLFLSGFLLPPAMTPTSLHGVAGSSSVVPQVNYVAVDNDGEPSAKHFELLRGRQRRSWEHRRSLHYPTGPRLCPQRELFHCHSR